MEPSGQSTIAGFALPTSHPLADNHAAHHKADKKNSDGDNHEFAIYTEGEIVDSFTSSAVSAANAKVEAPQTSSRRSLPPHIWRVD